MKIRVASGSFIMNENDDSMALICTLPEGLQAGRRNEIQRTFESHTDFRIAADGVEIDFAASENTARTLLDFILFERLCCKSFSYEFGFGPPHSRVTLRVRAVGEQVATLQALYRSLVGL
jgi:hypothetical protein